MNTNTILGTVSLGVLLAACSAPPYPAPVADPVTEPGENEVFAYLRERYDRDRDGRISISEYTKSRSEFGRLDQDGSGFLNAADFAVRGKRQRALAPEDARRLRALHLLAWYFQTDSNPTHFQAFEADQALRLYDFNSDGRVGRTEFEARAQDQALHGRPPAARFAGLLESETTDPWERIVSGVDRNDDGFLTQGELSHFCQANRRDEIWNAITTPDRTRSTQELGRSANRGSLSGPKVGAIAPDFKLTLHDEDRSVRLSDYTGVQPVALIFGSYT